jgi:hypothetical protein
MHRRVIPNSLTHLSSEATRLPKPWGASSANRQRADIVLAFGLAIYFVYEVSRFQLAKVWPLRPRGDAWAMFELSRRVWDRGYLPAEAFRPGTLNFIFPSPPSAVLILKALTLAGPTIFTLTWLSLMAAGLLATMRLSLAADRLEFQFSWLVVGALTLMVADGPVMWDLRNWNCNLIYLGLVLAAYATVNRRPVLAGILIGISVSLRVYSFLLVIWLLARRFRRAFIAAGAALIVLWVICPILAFGPAGARAIYRGWFDQLEVVSGAWGYSMPFNPARPPLVTLRAAVSTLTAEDLFARKTQTLIGTLWAIWFAALVWYFSRAAKTRVGTPSRAALADWTVLLLAPLPLSPWLEPYHAIPIVPGVMLLILVALDDEVIRRDRLIACFTLAVLAIERLVHLPRSLEGFDLFARLLELVVALALLRSRLDPLPAPGTVASQRSANPREAIAIASHQGIRPSSGVARGLLGGCSVGLALRPD